MINNCHLYEPKKERKAFSELEILDKIRSSADVKAVPKEQLPLLCAELREELLKTVSKTGGHLASNLGAVELTVALHRVYDSTHDRLLFDVGHQCYAHKMLTGRREQFDSLRQLGGLSGFPKPCEAVDDACIAGHASTAISNALGMARARTLLGEDYDVCAVIGDGALTGGPAYEGLADCGASGEPIVVILNDNAMSISANVGGLARLLARQRVRPGYLAFKRFYRRTLGRYEPVHKALHRIKEWLKDLVLPDNMFEDMGFYYLGPIDGHDVKTLERTIRYAREQRIPVLVHALTVKGKGYARAEADPASYHGVGSFDPETGVGFAVKEDFSAVFGRELTRLADADEKIAAVTAAMTDGTGLSPFAKKHRQRFFDVGIAEAHGVSMSAGLAKQGMKPVFAVYSSFLQRGYDQLFHDISLDRLHAVFAVDRAGLVGADGETHQGAFDVGYLCQIPGMAVWSPASYAELRSMLALALAAEGPAAVRYPRGSEGGFREDCSAARAAVLRCGDDCTLVSYGILINEALAAAELLAARDVSAELIKLNRLDDPDFDLLCASVKKTGRLIVAEESAEAGSMGVRILAELARRGIPVKAVLRNLGGGIVEHGAVPALRQKLKIDGAGIAAAYEELNA